MKWIPFDQAPLADPDSDYGKEVLAYFPGWEEYRLIVHHRVLGWVDSESRMRVSGASHFSYLVKPT